MWRWHSRGAGTALPHNPRGLPLTAHTLESSGDKGKWLRGQSLELQGHPP